MTVLLYSVFIILTAVSLLDVFSDYRRGALLTNRSVYLVWSSYFYQASLTLYWSIEGKLRLALPFPAILGPLFVLIGTTITIIGIWNFHSFKRISGLQADSLITGGIYRFSRNPQNIGWLFIIFGIGYAGESGLAFSLVLLFALCLHVYIVFAEEPLLIRVYGDQYKGYMTVAPRYIGVLRR